MFSTSFTSLSVLLLLPLSITFFVLINNFWFAFLVFWDFNVHHKDWLTYSRGNIDLLNYVITFLSQMTLLRWLTFLLVSLTVNLTVLLFLHVFIYSDASICSILAFSPLGNSDHVFVSIFIDFPINSKQDALFHRIAYYCSHADWDNLCDHLRDVPWGGYL